MELIEYVFGCIYGYLENYEESHRLELVCRSFKKFIDRYTIERFRKVKENLADILYHRGNIGTIRTVIQYDDLVILKYTLRLLRMHVKHENVADQIFRKAMRLGSIDIMVYTSKHVKAAYRVIRTLLKGVAKHEQVIGLVMQMLSDFLDPRNLTSYDLVCGQLASLEMIGGMDIGLSFDDNLRIPTVKYLVSMPEFICRNISRYRMVITLMSSPNLYVNPQRLHLDPVSEIISKASCASEAKFAGYIFKHLRSWCCLYSKGTINLICSKRSVSLILKMVFCTNRKELSHLFTSASSRNPEVIRLIICAAIISGNILMIELIKLHKYNKFPELDIKSLPIKPISLRMYDDIRSMFPDWNDNSIEIGKHPSAASMDSCRKRRKLT
jgi:hypothetical protein